MGRAAGHRDLDVAWLEHAHRLPRRDGQLHGSRLRRRHHGAGLDAPRDRAGRVRPSQGGDPRRRNACRVVADDPDNRSPARVADYGAGGDDDRGAAPSHGSSTTWTLTQAEVRDARPALREHLDWRNAHPLRRAAHADGGPALGVEHAVRARAFRLACGACGRPVGARLLPLVSTRASIAGAGGAPAPRSPSRRAGRLPIPWWVTTTMSPFSCGPS